MAGKRKEQLMFRLTEGQKKALSEEIEAFYHVVREEEIGIIHREQLVDLFLEKLGPIIYNKALDDVFSWYKNVAENMESDFYSLYKGGV